MNTKTLFKRSDRPNILTFIINTLYQINNISGITCKITSDVIFLTSNSTNRCTDEDHVVSTDAARVATSNTTVFSLLGIGKREGVNNPLRFLFLLRTTLNVYLGNKVFKLSSLCIRGKCFLIRVLMQGKLGL